MPPRIYIHSWFRHPICSKRWYDDLSLGSQTCFNACAMRELAAYIVQSGARSTGHALACMTSELVKRGQAFGAWAAVRFLLLLVLANALRKDSKVKTNPHIQEELDVVKGAGIWSCIGCLPQRILLPTKVSKSG